MALAFQPRVYPREKRDEDFLVSSVLGSADEIRCIAAPRVKYSDAGPKAALT